MNKAMFITYSNFIRQAFAEYAYVGLISTLQKFKLIMQARAIPITVNYNYSTVFICGVSMVYIVLDFVCIKYNLFPLLLTSKLVLLKIILYMYQKSRYM